MTNREVVRRVAALAEPICQQAGVSLWDVTFEKEGRRHTLTVYIDREEGVSINHCEQVSRALDPLLDDREFDSLPSYVLSVSSAGLERPLTRPEHFAWAEGRMVHLTFYRSVEGADSREGVLVSRDESGVSLREGEEVKCYPLSDIAQVRVCFEG